MIPAIDRRMLLRVAAALAVTFPVQALAAKARDIARQARATRDQLYATNPKARELGRRAKAVLVFPDIRKAGAMVGGQHGQGALFVGDEVKSFYSIDAASVGLQLGVQKFAYALFLITDKALQDALVIDIWTATRAAFPTIQGLDFSSAYLDSGNAVIDLDASRKAARAARAPQAVFVVLFIYLVVTAGVLGYVLKGTRGRLAAAFLLALLTLSLALIIDIDRPMLGEMLESQRPMEDLRSSLTARPTSVFDRWR